MVFDWYIIVALVSLGYGMLNSNMVGVLYGVYSHPDCIWKQNLIGRFFEEHWTRYELSLCFYFYFSVYVHVAQVIVCTVYICNHFVFFLFVNNCIKNRTKKTRTWQDIVLNPNEKLFRWQKTVQNPNEKMFRWRKNAQNPSKKKPRCQKKDKNPNKKLFRYQKINETTTNYYIYIHIIYDNIKIISTIYYVITKLQIYDKNRDSYIYIYRYISKKKKKINNVKNYVTKHDITLSYQRETQMLIILEKVNNNKYNMIKNNKKTNIITSTITNKKQNKKNDIKKCYNKKNTNNSIWHLYGILNMKKTKQKQNIINKNKKTIIKTDYIYIYYAYIKPHTNKVPKKKKKYVKKNN